MKAATRILVVDDDPTVIDLYALILSRANYEVSTATTGVAGLAAARAGRPDVVLLDVILPDVSGLEICRQLKQEPTLPDVFVALCSGLATSSAHKVDGLDSGADDYIAKPVQPEELLARVRAMVRMQATSAALRASEQHYRRLVEILPDAVGLVDREGRLRAANSRARLLLSETTEAELLQRSIFDLTAPANHKPIRELLRNPQSAQFPQHLEYDLQTKNGATIPVELSVTVTADATGMPTGFVVVARDASKRKRAEARRAAFSRLGKSLSEASTTKEAAQIIVDVADEVFGWDCCHVRLVSPGPERMVPILSYDEINGRRTEIPAVSFSMDATPMTRYVMEHGAQLVNNDGRDATRLPPLTPFGDAERRCASRLFAPMRKGAVQLGIISIQSYRLHAYQPEDLELFQALADHCFGALERINFAESLQESEGRFRSLFESAPLGLALHDARGHYLNTNQAYQEMLGYSDDELRRVGVKGITIPEDIAEGQHLFEELRGGRLNYYRREKRYRHRNGHLVWAESYASAVRDAEGHLRFIVSMVDDITARKQTEAEIRRLNETLEQRVRVRTIELEAVNAALRENEQQLRLTLEASNAGTWAWEAASNRSVWDQRYHDLYGFRPEDPITFETWISRVHPEDRTRLLAHIEAVTRSSAADLWNEEFRATHPEKGERWMAGIGRVIRDSAGHLVRMVGINLDITARKHAEESVRQLNEVLEQRVQERTIELETVNEALRESEARFRQLAENINEVFWMSDPGKAQMLYVSPAYERVWGRSVQTLAESPMSWVEAVHPEDRARVRAAVSKQISGDYDEQYRITRPDGSICWIRDRAYPVRDAQGKVYRVVGVAEDVTRRKQTEEALRDSEVRKGAIMESALDAIITLDQTGRILEFNTAAEKMFGYARSRLIGKEFVTVIVAPPLREWFEQGLACRFSGEQGPMPGCQMEMQAVRAGGIVFPTEVTLARIGVDGPPLFTAFLRDITEKRRTEEQIRLLADAVQSTRELVSVTDQQNRFTFVNQAFREAYGYTDAEILGRTPEVLYSAANPAKLCATVYRQTLGGGWNGEIVNRRKDGSEFPIALNTSIIKSRSGQTLGLVGVAMDVSERKRAEKQSAAVALLGHRLSATASAEQAAEVILEIAGGLFGWDAGYVHLLRPTEATILPILTMDTVNGQRKRVQPTRPRLHPTPLMQSVLKQGSRLINRTKDSGPKLELVRFGDTQRPSASMMYVPIHAGATVLGILSLQSYTPQAYTERDLHLLKILADQCGGALQRIEVAEALRVAEAKYRGIVENATEGIFQTTPEGRYLSANPAQARMLGFESSEALLMSVTNIELQTYVQPERRRELQQLFESQGKVSDFEAERIRKDGRKIWTSVNGHVVRDAQGAVLFYECTSQDITERKLAEQELRLMSHRIIETQEAERQRVARELHDGVNQLLASAKMRLNKVGARTPDLGPATREILNRCEALLVQALEENRRIAHNLRPTDLDHLGLAESCRNFCRELTTHSHLKVKCRISGLAERLPANLELNLFRIVQEATNNIQKHARAKSVRISLTQRDGFVQLKIQDDGRGFDVGRPHAGKKIRRGTGLTNMRERAAAIGGTCELDSIPKRGSTIIVRVPATEMKQKPYRNDPIK